MSKANVNKPIAREDRGGFVERLMRRRAPASQVVVVHRGEVVVHQRIAMHAFHGEPARSGGSPAAPNARAVSIVRNGRSLLPPPSAP